MTQKQQIRKFMREIKSSVTNLDEYLDRQLGLSEDDCSDIIIEAENIEDLALRIIDTAAIAEQEMAEERRQGDAVHP